MNYDEGITWYILHKQQKDYQPITLESIFFSKPMQPNNGVTCPAITTRNFAGKDFSPHHQAGGSAAPAGSGLRGVGRHGHFKFSTFLLAQVNECQQLSYMFFCFSLII